jgi:hypothetical protein
MEHRHIDDHPTPADKAELHKLPEPGVTRLMA